MDRGRGPDDSHHDGDEEPMRIGEHDGLTDRRRAAKAAKAGKG
jgi:hypothetical protein